MQMSDDMPPRKRSEKRIYLLPGSTLYRVSPCGDYTFICRAGDAKVQDLTVEVYEGDRLEFKHKQRLTKTL